MNRKNGGRNGLMINDKVTEETHNREKKLKADTGSKRKLSMKI